MLLFKKLRKGDTPNRISAEDLNKVFRILENLKGVGCSVQKDPMGLSWRIVVDGYSSDEALPEELTEKIDDGGVIVGKVIGKQDGFVLVNLMEDDGTFGDVAYRVIFPEITPERYLPPASQILCHKSQIKVVGGSEQEEPEEEE